MSAGFETVRTLRETCAFFGDLLIFVDETGDESLKDPNVPLFGYGACIAMYDDYQKRVAIPWMEMKAKHFATATGPFHAKTHLRSLSRRQAATTFFRNHPFHRVGATITTATAIAGETNEHGAATGGFLVRLKDMLDQIGSTSFRRLFLIFEDSARGSPKLESHMKHLGMNRSFTDGHSVLTQTVPVRRFFLPKSAGEAGLEVADAIAHAAAAQTRKLAGTVPGRGLYDAVFNTHRHLSSFSRLDTVTREPDPPGSIV